MALDFLSNETKFFIYLYVHIKSNLKFQSVKKKKKLKFTKIAMFNFFVSWLTKYFLLRD